VTTPDPCPRLQPLLSPRIYQAGRIAILAVFICLTGLCAAGSDSPAHKTGQPKPYALIFGTVWGPDNQPVYGVKVKIRRASDQKARWELYSNHAGEFAQRVPAAREDYVIWVDLDGYKSQTGKRLEPGEPAKVHVEYDERVDTGLHLK
jgi:hypothetical protein